MTPEVCVATIDALPATGGDAGGVIVLAALAAVVVLAGLALLVLRRRRAAGAAAALAALAVAGALTFAPAPPANAASGSVSYADGCSLLAVSDVTVPPSSPGGGLVPGDEVQIVSAVVANPTDAPIEITLRADLGDRLAPSVSARTSIRGVDGDTITLVPGGRVTVGLFVGMTTAVGNDAQGLRAAASLIVTATQR